MTYDEEIKKLNDVVAGISEAVGDKCLLGMFMMCHNQPYVRISRIEIGDGVCISRHECLGDKVTEIYVERTLMALQRMRDNIDETIKILQKQKGM